MKLETFSVIYLNIRFLEVSENFLGIQKRVWISHCKRGIGIQAIEVLFYY